MTEEAPEETPAVEELQPHPESPHQRMLDFLAEGDAITADIPEPNGL